MARARVATAWLMLLSSSIAYADVDLGIAPVQQQTPVWCWLAVGEMVFRYLGVPSVNDTSYQCGVIAAMSLASNRAQCASDCMRCNTPAGDSSRVMGMLVDYPRRASLLTGARTFRVFVSPAAALSADELVRELDAHRPVVAGINPNARPAAFVGSQHVALIEGYARVRSDDVDSTTTGSPSDDSGLILVVNDPFPFSPRVWADPYLPAGGRMLMPGRYAIDYRAFVDKLGYAESFLVRTDGHHEGSAMRCLSSTPRASSFCPASPVASVGAACACDGIAGVVVDTRE